MPTKFKLFWGGIYSQWYMANMYDPILDMHFNCCEQYMMYCKAKVFGDKEAMDKIMTLKDPKQQKAMGRKVKNFDAATWNAVARDVVVQANVLKFSQNRKLLAEIIKDKDCTFVEASPVDKIWGIGLAENDPDALDPTKWQGTNWLGESINVALNRILMVNNISRTF